MRRRMLVFLGFLVASAAHGQPSVLQSNVYKVRPDGKRHVRVLTTQFRPYGFESLKGAPFSSDQRHTTGRTLSDGTRINPGSAVGPKMFRDSEGRTRVERVAGSQAIWPDGREAPPPPTLIEIDDVVSGYFYVLDAERKIAYRSKHPPVPARTVQPEQKRAEQAAPPPPVSGRPPTTVEDLGIKVIQGVQTDGERRTTVWPVGSRGNDRPLTEVSEMWKSRQLELVILSSKKSLENESTTELIELSLVEPPADLFRAPSGYQVIEPNGEFTIEIHVGPPPPPPGTSR